MNSHEFAKRLHEIADFLLSRPEFKTAGTPFIFQSYYDKDEFLAAVKAVGSGKKSEENYTSHPDICFEPTGAPEITLRIAKNKLCVLVQPAVYDCVPFLSQAEEASLGEKSA